MRGSTENTTVELMTCGREDCSNLHSYGPGVRTCYIVHYIVHGRGTLICNGKAYPVGEGESFVIRPLDVVRYFPDPQDPWEYTWIDFQGKECNALLDRIAFKLDDRVIAAVSPALILPLYELLRGLFQYAGRNHAANAMGLAILGLYADVFPAAAKPRETVCFEAARRMIQWGFHRPDLTLDTICGSLGVSRATLHRNFISSCGVAPGEYLNRYRMERAGELLARGTSVKTTALSCGFRDPLYFSKTFRTHYDCTPTDYRRQHADQSAE